MPDLTLSEPYLTLPERRLAETLAGTLVYLNANDAQVLAMARSWAREIGSTNADRFVFLVRRGVHLIRTNNVQQVEKILDQLQGERG